ncbi:YdgA family protein [Deinococcus rubellus]|uniref:YdgA family protein n=1 Tax=Deinococcus rubellus TaxID=1889240 RepID=A0ABY5YH43_9DEIO|nr:YdgA family protein [Deinococcus rubellus]UWX64397.1 YdgA family protein [Deinococcus rubellus]
MTRPSTGPRRSRLPALGIGVLIVVGALAGATAYTGSQTVQTQQDLAQTLKAQVNATGYARVISSTYQRGFLSSTQTLNVVIGKEGAANAVPMIVVNHIQHGPLPGFKAVGNALIDTEVRFADPALQKKVEDALGGQKPTIRTVVGLSGSTDTQIEVPGGQLTDSGTTLSWQALRGNVHNGGLSATTQMSWPELKVTSDGDSLTMNGLSVSGSTQKQQAGDPLGVGEQMFTLKSMTYTGTSGETQGKFNLSDLKVGGKSTLVGGFYGGSLQYDIGQLDFEMPGSSAQNFRNVQLHLGMNHLSREPLARIVNTLTNLNQQLSRAPERAKLSKAQEQALMDDALALLKAQPVFSVDRLSLTQPSGDIVLSGKAELPGAADLSAETAQMLSKVPMAALGMVKLQARLSAAEPALRELLGSFAPDAAASLQSLIDAGYLKRQGNTLTSDLAFGNGKGTVNGEALGGGF